MSAENRAVVCRLVRDVLNHGNTRLLDALVARDHVLHAPEGDLYGPEGVRIVVSELRRGFPDLEVTGEETSACGGWVMQRLVLRGTHAGPFLGVPGRGRVVLLTGIGIHRLAAGLVTESWLSFDGLALCRQLGTCQEHGDL